MRGKTVMICDGLEWDPETKKYNKTVCFGKCHGEIYYGCDVRRFLQT